MILLRLISWPYFRKHLLRTALTTAGIVLGVAVFVGMHTANQTVLLSFSQTVDRIAGKTQLQVSAGEAGFGEEVLDLVQSASTVRVGVPIIEVVVDSNIPGEGNLLVLGVDMTGDRSLRDYDLEGGGDAEIDDPLIFLAQPDSLILSKELADRHHIAVGSRLPLGTSGGQRTFTVRGIIKSTGLASAFGGNIAIMDIYAAQHMFGRGRTFDRIDIAMKPGVTLTDCQRELHALIGSGFDVQPPSGRGQQFESMLASYSLMVSISSAFALFIGMFIIYNSFSIAVTERRAEIGILRAIGATRGQIRWIFLGESAAIGLIGSVAGLAFGVLMARGIAFGIGALISDVYRVGQTVDAMAISPGLLALSLAIGVATSVVAAAIPAQNAARLDPIQALQKGRYHVLSAGESRVRIAAAAVLALFSAITLTVASTSRPLFYAGYLSAMLAALLLVPLLTLGLAKTFRPLLQWLRPVEGALAADSLIQAPRRTSASVAALMFSLALAVAFEGMGLSNYSSMVDWMDSVLNPDLFVLPSQSFDIRAARFPATMASEIAAVPGVDRVQMLRNGRTTFRGAPVMVIALEMSSIAQTIHRRPVAGEAGDMYRRAAAGEGLVLSDNFAELQHLRLGDQVEIAAPYGVIRLPVVGILVDYSDQQGAIMIDRTLFIKYWHDDSVNMFRVYTRPDADALAVRTHLLERFAGQRQVFVLTNAELKTYILGVLGQWFRLTSIQIGVAVLVAILGIINTLTVSIKDRRRELGVLRVVGALHWQVRRTIWIEALSVGAFGLILGSALGALNLYYVLQIVHRDVTGMRLAYQFPLMTVVALVPTIIVAALVAALWPAESAVRGSLVEALAYE
ncbi:MAG: FtsX-like permease family protein [Vicinamibacterales bacterium]